MNKTEPTLEDFKKAIGKKFRLRGYSEGILARQDTIIEVRPDGMVEGEFFIAHYSNCRFVENQPPQLTKTVPRENIS
ncbi:MAG TPA: hypothetical protein VG847_00995 [Chitinophagaceae bacterium]|nr:hypothetical protein [Chitinophagaceae bacterium]